MTSSLTKNRLKAKKLIEKGLAERGFSGKWPVFYRRSSNQTEVIGIRTPKYGGAYSLCMSRLKRDDKIPEHTDQMTVDSYNLKNLGHTTIRIKDEDWFLPKNERNEQQFSFYVNYNEASAENHPLLPELSEEELADLPIEEQVNRLFTLLDTEGKFFFLTGRRNVYDEEIKSFLKGF